MAWQKYLYWLALAALFSASSGVGRVQGEELSPELTNILIYADDYYHAPNTFVDQALTYLGKSYTAYHSDQAGFIDTLGDSGPWDLVIFAHEIYALDGDMYEALNKYASEGGKLIFQSFTVSSHTADPLLQTLGVTFVENDLDPPASIFWWKPGYPAFSYPLQMPEFTSMVSRSAYSIYGQYVQPRSGFGAWAGYTTPGPNRNQAALVVGNENRTVFKGFMDGQNSADLDSDGMLDGVELWINLINWILDPGSFGIVRGSVTGLGYCDSSPAALPNAWVYLLPNSGGTFLLITNASGEYEWWTQVNGLIDLLVLHGNHEIGFMSGIQVSPGSTSTADFYLRLVVPCVKLSTLGVTQYLQPGTNRTLQLGIENQGAGIANWDVDERTGPFQPPSDIAWVSTSPITGTLAANSNQWLDVRFEALGGMAAGRDTGFLVVNTNDPNANALPITLTMQIGSDLLYLPLVEKNP